MGAPFVFAQFSLCFSRTHSWREHERMKREKICRVGLGRNSVWGYFRVILFYFLWKENGKLLCRPRRKFPVCVRTWDAQKDPSIVVAFEKAAEKAILMNVMAKVFYILFEPRNFPFCSLFKRWKRSRKLSASLCCWNECGIQSHKSFCFWHPDHFERPQFPPFETQLSDVRASFQIKKCFFSEIGYLWGMERPIDPL